MSVSTDGQICYGVKVPEGTEFAWDDHVGGHDGWWTEHFGKAKIPFNVVNVCSLEYPLYILCVPSSFMYAGRGQPVSFDLSELKVSEEEVAALLTFCAQYGIEHEPPAWYLSSYWG